MITSLTITEASFDQRYTGNANSYVRIHSNNCHANTLIRKLIPYSKDANANHEADLTTGREMRGKEKRVSEIHVAFAYEAPFPCMYVKGYRQRYARRALAITLITG